MSTVVSLSEPARILLMGVGLLFVGRVCASKHKRPGRTACLQSHTSHRWCV